MESLVLHDGAELDDVVAVQRAFAHHHLESVFIGRVVAAGDLNPAVEVEVVYGEIQEGRRADPDIDHVQACLVQPYAKGLVKAR